MRKTALVRCPISETRRLMISTLDDATHLFGYFTLSDTAANWDEWFATVAEAEATALEGYGVEPADWQPLPDALPDCQHDWIAPVRVKGRAEGQPQWGHLEQLVQGQWLPLPPAP